MGSCGGEKLEGKFGLELEKWILSTDFITG